MKIKNGVIVLFAVLIGYFTGNIVPLPAQYLYASENSSEDKFMEETSRYWEKIQ